MSRDPLYDDRPETPERTARMKRAQELWDAVQENRARLDACVAHDFSIDRSPEKPLGKTFACRRCGGTVDSIHKHWYERGLAHGRAHAAIG